MLVGAGATSYISFSDGARGKREDARMGDEQESMDRRTIISKGSDGIAAVNQKNEKDVPKGVIFA